MSKLGTKSRPAIIKLGPNSQQDLILEVMNKYGIQFIAGMENEEDLTDLQGLISKADYARIADPDAVSSIVKASVSQLISARPGRNAPCTCGSGKQYKRCCGK